MWFKLWLIPSYLIIMRFLNIWIDWQPYYLYTYISCALCHLFQPSQGRKQTKHTWSNHTSQTNRALGLKRALARFRLPSVSSPVFSRIPRTRVSPIKCCPVPHSVALGPVIVQVSTRKVPVMIEALDSEHNFFYNKLFNIFYKNINAVAKTLYFQKYSVTPF